MKGRQEQTREDHSNSNPPSDLESGHRPSLPSIRFMFPREFTQPGSPDSGSLPRSDYPQFHGQQQQQQYPGYSQVQFQQQHYPQQQQQQPQQVLPPSSQRSYGGSGHPPATSNNNNPDALSYPYPSAQTHYLPSQPSASAPASNVTRSNPASQHLPPAGQPAPASAYPPYDPNGPRSPTFTATTSIPSPNSNSNTGSSSHAPVHHAPHHPHLHPQPSGQQQPLRDGPMFIRLGTTANGSLEVNARSDNPRGLSSVQSTWIDPKEPGAGGGARHVCELCHRTFDRPSTLRTHMNAHTGSKPYLCSKCGRGFGASSNMRRHERSCREGGPAQSPQSPGSNTST
ncbi:hypothetical protein BKA62DRAFT_313981 [Auriculariales sp. MPI-PUGE-AT-0066]|nr:hypothetical protein BKA62DRAFT_313981 [Auriculariales sp. MPI-PUGE-AT-0066]